MRPLVRARDVVLRTFIRPERRALRRGRKGPLPGTAHRGRFQVFPSYGHRLRHCRRPTWPTILRAEVGHAGNRRDPAQACGLMVAPCGFAAPGLSSAMILTAKFRLAALGVAVGLMGV